MSNYQSIKIIDSHTAGEPTRVIYDGFPSLQGTSLKEKKEDFEKQFDYLRKALILEPRGSDIVVGALLCKPQDPKAVTGVIFFNNAGYLGMCGHGTIGVIETLRYLGKIQAGTHKIETPVGTVECTLHANNEISVQNVPSYRYKKDLSIDVDGIGKITGDIAWGGNWFFLVNNHGQEINANNLEHLTEFSWKIRQALDRQKIRAKENAIVDHIELFSKTHTANSRSFVLCPGKAYDRSPCGTGTSAKLACLAADNKLLPQQQWIQESVIGSQFKASYQILDKDTIIPTITGRAYIHADSTILLDQQDPFKYGIVTR